MKNQFDPLKFSLHFVFGLFIGVFAVLPWGFNLLSPVAIVAILLIATIGGFYGDRFWHWFINSFWFR
ncbi:MAG: hypothetical protein KME17_01380 [Cyanosarcina radialis HA8281-LM2]|jgi:hypothetical protein|nr:hypothetical protein [Cyanosarcina radialis HA8281-LM2]